MGIVIEFEKNGVVEKMEQAKIARGLKVLGAVGVAGIAVGFKLGRDNGYKHGVADGYTTASKEFIEAMKELTTELKDMRNEE